MVIMYNFVNYNDCIAFLDNCSSMIVLSIYDATVISVFIDAAFGNRFVFHNITHQCIEYE